MKTTNLKSAGPGLPCCGQGGAKVWPQWARLLECQKVAGERGVGDTAERLFGLWGSDAFKAWHVKFFGHPCVSECPKEWNAAWPYKQGIPQAV